MPVVEDGGIHMHGRADSVATEALDDAPLTLQVGARLIDTGLDRMRDIAQLRTWVRLSQAVPQCLFARSRQRGCLDCDRADLNGDGGVAVPAVDDRTEIDRDQVTVGQNL